MRTNKRDAYVHHPYFWIVLGVRSTLSSARVHHARARFGNIHSNDRGALCALESSLLCGSTKTTFTPLSRPSANTLVNLSCHGCGPSSSARETKREDRNAVGGEKEVSEHIHGARHHHSQEPGITGVRTPPSSCHFSTVAAELQLIVAEAAATVECINKPPPPPPQPQTAATLYRLEHTTKFPSSQLLGN